MKCPYCNKAIEDRDLGEFFDCPYCNSALQLEDQELILIKEADSSISGMTQEFSGEEEVLSEEVEELATEQPLQEESQVEELEEVNKEVMSEGKSSLEDIVQFGNSPSQKNHFSYHLQIEGIFSSDLQKRVQKIVSSKALRLDTAKIFSKINDGKLSISNLNAAKTVYLVRKLSSLPVEIAWVQESRL